MSSTILATKLYLPPKRPKTVRRSRLVERLNDGLEGKLTLVSAPAGFGKTTLVSEWVSGLERPVCWLSLDEGDNDPTVFLDYLVAALQKVEAEFGAGIVQLLHSPQRVPLDQLLARLLNEIAALPDSFVLVLDDYHLIEETAVDDALTFLLERQPPQMHLVITTREDPPLPLARMRARGQLTEIRAGDLRFLGQETADFLNSVMALNLSEQEVTALEGRTEGWIAGLQLAALAVQGKGPGLAGAQTDTAQFIEAFTGSHRYVLDYLVEEVLQQQPEAVRDFLLQTSILERMNGDLCEAVWLRTADVPQPDAKSMLDRLERDNLFVVPLDDTRQWYRYHHLFADVLRANLLAERPSEVPTLHLRASQWYETHAFWAEAINHALAAPDYERAAALVEVVWPTMELRSQTATWLGWANALPEDLFWNRPVLNMAYVWAILGIGGGKLEMAEARVEEAERWLTEGPGTGETAEMIVVDQTQFKGLRAAIPVARAYIKMANGDMAGSVAYARQTLEMLPEDEFRWRSIAQVFLGIAYWERGELELAFESLGNFATDMERAGDDNTAAISIAAMLADIRMVQGRLRDTVKLYEHSLQLATKDPGQILRGTAELAVGLGELYAERGELETAAQYLGQAEALGEGAMLIGNEYRLFPAKARIKAALGEVEEALVWLDEGERLFYRTPMPDLRPIAAQRVRLWLQQRRLAEAVDWVRARGLAVSDPVDFLSEYELMTLARVSVALYRQQPETADLEAILGLLERLLAAAEAGKRWGSVIEILILEALVHEAKGDMLAALDSLKRALNLAEPEGYVRLFVEEGDSMKGLLGAIGSSTGQAEYVGRLIAAFEGSSAVSQPLVDPLSERELDVLRLLDTDMTGPEIAETLMVSLNTMRTHTKNIYSKLGANSRRTAVRQAHDLGLLP